MSATSDHIQTAVDQLKNAESCAHTGAQLTEVFQTGAVVHALIAVAEAIREAGAGVAGWSETDAPNWLDE
jgi:hypothetical protein